MILCTVNADRHFPSSRPFFLSFPSYPSISLVLSFFPVLSFYLCYPIFLSHPIFLSGPIFLSFSSFLTLSFFFLILSSFFILSSFLSNSWQAVGMTKNVIFFSSKVIVTVGQARIFVGKWWDKIHYISVVRLFSYAANLLKPTEKKPIFSCTESAGE